MNPNEGGGYAPLCDGMVVLVVRGMGVMEDE